MPPRSPRSATPLLATVSACLILGGPAQAQTASTQAEGPTAASRYLSWANRPADTTPGHVTAARSRARDGIIPRRVAPSQAVRRPTMQPTAQPAAAAYGLTPATAWLGPRVAPAFAPGSPDPIAYATRDLSEPPTATPAPTPRAAPAPPVSTTAPRPAPDVEPAADPMAPRRDAPIFRLQRQNPAGDAQTPAASVDQPDPVPSAQQGARYYSLHRDAGRRPDSIAMPDPVFFDSVQLDLAEPPATEPVLRDAQGRRQVVPNADPSLP